MPKNENSWRKNNLSVKIMNDVFLKFYYLFVRLMDSSRLFDRVSDRPKITVSFSNCFLRCLLTQKARMAITIIINSSTPITIPAISPG